MISIVVDIGKKVPAFAFDNWQGRRFQFLKSRYTGFKSVDCVVGFGKLGWKSVPSDGCRSQDG